MLRSNDKCEAKGKQVALRLSPEEFTRLQKRPKTRADVPARVPKPNKYKARAVGGYASVKEARRAQELKLLRDAGKIRNLREQVVFELIPKQGKERACKYVADFVYEDSAPHPVTGIMQWWPIVEDVKGVRTKDYVLKRKMMLFFHHISIKEI